MGINNTTLTRLAEPKAVEAPEWGVAGATTLTGGGFGPQILCFVFDQLVGNFVWVLKPLIEVRLKMREGLSSSKVKERPDRNRTTGSFPGLLRGRVIRG